MNLYQLAQIDREITQKIRAKPLFVRVHSIPSNLPLEKEKWLVVDNVTSVFVDLTDSTSLAVGNKYDATSILGYYARALIEIFEYYNSAYLDYQGDGGFSLFDGVDSVKKAIDCAITLNTLLNREKRLGIRIGIDVGTIYAKKVGKRGNNKELWLGRPVSYSSKLCNLKNDYLSPIRISRGVYYSLHQIYKQWCRPIDNDIYHSDMFWEF